VDIDVELAIALTTTNAATPGSSLPLAMLRSLSTLRPPWRHSCDAGDTLHEWNGGRNDDPHDGRCTGSPALA